MERDSVLLTMLRGIILAISVHLVNETAATIKRNNKRKQAISQAFFNA